MPFIDVKLSCELTGPQETALKARLGEAIFLLPGKSEASLMLQFTDRCRLWFGGSQEGPLAMVNVMLLGSASKADYSAFSSRVIEILHEEIQTVCTYVKFEEVPNWFWD